MMIAPNADPADGLIEYVRWGPIGRAGLLVTLPRLFTGTHIHHPLAERAAVKRVEFRTRRSGERDDGRREFAACSASRSRYCPAAMDVIV